ncbi:MAG: DUF1573 domain-containing protein [Bacteroidota bacterium]
MKRLFSLLTIFSLVATFAIAQTDGAATKEAPAEGGPVMSLESTEVDYGTIEQGADPLRVFKFSNTGNEPLQITNAKGSCGCTVPKWPKEPIFPGESAEIEVRYDTKRIGKFTKRVTLSTNDKVGKHVLTIKGEVKKKAPEPEGVPSSQPSIFSSPNNN